MNLPAIPSIETLLFPSLTLSFPSSRKTLKAFPASLATTSAFSFSFPAAASAFDALVVGLAADVDRDDGVGVAADLDEEGGGNGGASCSALKPDFARFERVARDALIVAEACFARSSTVRRAS